MSDELDFAVVFKFDRGRAAIFEGTQEATYHWLSKVDQHSIWEVWDRSTGLYESATEFLERLAKAYKPKPPLTEKDVRRIVDGRIKQVLVTLKKEADDRSIGLAAYEETQRSRSAYATFSLLAQSVIRKLGEQE